MTDFEEEIAVVIRRNGTGSVLTYDDGDMVADDDVPNWVERVVSVVSQRLIGGQV